MEIGKLKEPVLSRPCCIRGIHYESKERREIFQRWHGSRRIIKHGVWVGE